MIKRWKTTKLGLLLVGYFGLAMAIAAFSYGFLYTTSWAVSYRFNEEFGVVSSSGSVELNNEWVVLVCLVGAIVVFIAALLFLLQQKFSYVLAISNMVKQLEGGDLSVRVEIIGDDELTDLAESINSMATALERHMVNEERLHKEKNEIVASLSHDLRTPLTSIISYIDLIKAGQYDTAEKRDRYLEIIQGKAYQIKEITDELFEHSSTKEKVLRREVIDVAVLLGQLIDDKEDELSDEGFQVEVHTQLSSIQKELEVLDLVRIFDNLSSNIIKYGAKENPVVWSIVVDRQGISIQQKNKISLFSAEAQSNGIGLNSCRSIVESYKGSIKVRADQEAFHIEMYIPI